MYQRNHAARVQQSLGREVVHPHFPLNPIFSQVEMCDARSLNIKRGSPVCSTLLCLDISPGSALPTLYVSHSPNRVDLYGSEEDEAEMWVPGSGRASFLGAAACLAPLGVDFTLLEGPIRSSITMYLSTISTSWPAVVVSPYLTQHCRLSGRDLRYCSSRLHNVI